VESVFRRTLEFLRDRPGYAGFLRAIVDWEEESEDHAKHGWRYSDVLIPPSLIVRLLNAGIAVRSRWSTSKHKRYLLADRESVRSALNLIELGEGVAGVEVPFEIPENLFADVVGYEDVKRLFLKGLEGGVHFLMVGPPASAKSLFLLCLETLPRSKYVLGSRVSKAGLTDYLITHQPRVLLLDEVDKLRGEDYGVLLSLCETGRVSETLYSRTREIALEITVFACANDLKRIPAEVIDRFEVLRFPEYTREQFIDVVENVLARRGVEEGLAVYIAKQVWDLLGKRSLREAIRVARLAETKEEVDELVKVLRKYK